MVAKTGLTRRHLLLILKLLLAAALFLFLIHNAQFKPALLLQFFSHPDVLAAVVALFMLQVVLVSMRWSLLNTAQQVTLNFYNTFAATYIGAAFNNILPGSVGGDFVRWFYLVKKIPDKKSAILFSVFLDRILGLVGVIIVALIFSSRMHVVSQNPNLYYPLLLFALLCMGLLAAFFIMIFIAGKKQLDHFFLQRFPAQQWAKRAAAFFNALKTYHISKSAITKCLLLSLIIQIVMGMTVKIIAEMMGFSGVSLTDYIVASGLTLVVNLIPATPGGVGIGEMAFANILILLNPGTNAAFATVYFAYRLMCTLSYLPGVICIIPAYLKNGETLNSLSS